MLDEADEGMFSAKRHVSQGEVVLAACDADILGKCFEEEDLRIVVEEGFYGGEKVDPETLSRLMNLATIINLVGERVVALAIEMELVDRDCVIVIQGVPHAQILKLV